MASSRLLYVAGEVTPFAFAEASDTASLVRALPEALRKKDFDARIMMPRYGSISERENNLHEVIRLSGAEISMGESGSKTLTVKVASLPDVRLQVYFMDNENYFGREGLATAEDGTPYPDNAERSLFFTRAVMETVRSLRWGPDLVHAFGWVGGLLPMLLHSEGRGDDLFDPAKVVYTPDGIDAGAGLSEDFIEAMGLHANGQTGQSLVDAGLGSADAAIYPPSLTAENGHAQFGKDADDHPRQAVNLYDEVLAEVAA